MASQLENVSACTYIQMDGEHKNITPLWPWHGLQRYKLYKIVGKE